MEKDLELPELKDPWGPLYFQKSPYSGALFYMDKDGNNVDLPAEVGYMVSDISLKRSLLFEIRFKSLGSKLRLLNKKLEKWDSDFLNLYNDNLVLKKENSFLKWVVLGESSVLTIIISILIIL